MGFRQIFIIAALLAFSDAKVQIFQDVDLANCGGALEADSGTLTFTSNALSQDVITCIWTIHLETTSTFRLNFSHFDLPADSSSCTEGAAVRLYSLTNLIPAERAESFTFCNEHPPTSNFILLENLITVIYHHSKESNNPNTGFTLNWEGISFAPIAKTHESTYTTASTGVIRHPPIVGGEYPTNLVSSWVVQASAIEQARQNLQVNLPFVNTETCPRGASRDCLCDALILYQVDAQGILEEDRRLCGNNTALNIDGVGANFILAWFTDNEDVVGEGTGFEVVYSPSSRPPVSNTSTTCGGVVSGLSGLIEYKRDERLDTRERCIWTIRTPSRTQIKLTFNKIGLEYWGDSMEVLGMSASGDKTQFAFSKQDNGTTITLNATVAIISLFTDYLGSGTGFSLSFESGETVDSALLRYSDFSYLENNRSCGSVIRYPGNGGQLKAKELTTFVIQRDYSPRAGYEPMTLNVTALNLRRDPETGNCTDVLRAFRLHSAPGNPTSLQEVYEYGKPFGVCQMDQVDNDPYYLVTDYVSVLFLLTDEGQGNSQEDVGFEVTWNVEMDDPSECGQDSHLKFL